MCGRSGGGAVVASVLAVLLAACRDHGVSSAAADRAASVRRKAALAGMRVWTRPTTAPSSVDLGVNTPGPGFLDATKDVDCDFRLEPIGGTTPKFHCTLNGDRVKVKYGTGNPEIPAQVAASRLLSALGFAVDRMMLVHSVRCHGCPPFPAQALECLQKGGRSSVCLEGASPSHVVTFEGAMIERPFPGDPVPDAGPPGWAWFELDAIDPEAGGSSRAEVDALRLMAVLLAHWDNKADNQRLVCTPGRLLPDGSCRTPSAVLHDLGATFGPLKVDLQNWRQVPTWTDPQQCRVSMATLPFNGGTFAEHAISEEGRQLALNLLRPITAAQANRLFETSGISRYPSVLAAARSPQSWTDVLLRKIDAIANAGPCTPAAVLHARGE